MTGTKDEKTTKTRGQIETERQKRESLKRKSESLGLEMEQNKLSQDIVQCQQFLRRAQELADEAKRGLDDDDSLKEKLVSQVEKAREILTQLSRDVEEAGVMDLGPDSVSGHQEEAVAYGTEPVPPKTEASKAPEAAVGQGEESDEEIMKEPDAYEYLKRILSELTIHARGFSVDLEVYSRDNPIEERKKKAKELRDLAPKVVQKMNFFLSEHPDFFDLIEVSFFRNCSDKVEIVFGEMNPIKLAYDLDSNLEELLRELIESPAAVEFVKRKKVERQLSNFISDNGYDGYDRDGRVSLEVGWGAGDLDVKEMKARIKKAVQIRDEEYPGACLKIFLGDEVKSDDNRAPSAAKFHWELDLSRPNWEGQMKHILEGKKIGSKLEEFFRAIINLDLAKFNGGHVFTQPDQRDSDLSAMEIRLVVANEFFSRLEEWLGAVPVEILVGGAENKTKLKNTGKSFVINLDLSDKDYLKKLLMLIAPLRNGIEEERAGKFEKLLQVKEEDLLQDFKARVAKAAEQASDKEGIEKYREVVVALFGEQDELVKKIDARLKPAEPDAEQKTKEEERKKEQEKANEDRKRAQEAEKKVQEEKEKKWDKELGVFRERLEDLEKKTKSALEKSPLDFGELSDLEWGFSEILADANNRIPIAAAESTKLYTALSRFSVDLHTKWLNFTSDVERKRKEFERQQAETPRVEEKPFAPDAGAVKVTPDSGEMEIDFEILKDAVPSEPTSVHPKADEIEASGEFDEEAWYSSPPLPESKQDDILSPEEGLKQLYLVPARIAGEIVNFVPNIIIHLLEKRKIAKYWDKRRAEVDAARKAEEVPEEPPVAQGPEPTEPPQETVVEPEVEPATAAEPTEIEVGRDGQDLEAARQKLVKAFVKWQEKSGWLSKTLGGEAKAKRELDEVWQEYSQARDAQVAASERNFGKLSDLLRADGEILQREIKEKYKGDVGLLQKGWRALRRVLPGKSAYTTMGDAHKIYRTIEEARSDALGNRYLLDALGIAKDAKEKKKEEKAMRNQWELSDFSRDSSKKLRKLEKQLEHYRGWAREKKVNVHYEEDYQKLSKQRDELFKKETFEQLTGLRREMKKYEVTAWKRGVDLDEDANYQRMLGMEKELSARTAETWPIAKQVDERWGMTLEQVRSLQTYLETTEKKDMSILNKALGDRGKKLRNALSVAAKGAIGLAVVSMLAQDSASVEGFHYSAPGAEPAEKVEKARKEQRHPYKVNYVDAGKDSRPVYYYPAEDEQEDDELVVRTDNPPKPAEEKKIEKKKPIKSEKKEVVITPDIEPLPGEDEDDYVATEDDSESTKTGDADKERKLTPKEKFDALEEVIDDSDYSRAEKRMLTNYLRIFEWRGRAIGEDGRKLKELLKQEGIVEDFENPLVKKWFDETLKKLLVQQKKAMHILGKWVERGDGFEEVKRSLNNQFFGDELREMVDDLQGGRVLLDTDRNYLDYEQDILLRELRHAFEPVEWKI